MNRMLDETEMQSINTGLILLRLIWVSLTAALAVYIVVANVIEEDVVIGRNHLDDAFDIVKYMLYLISALLLCAVYLIRRSVKKTDSVFSKMVGFITGSPTTRYILGLVISAALCQSVGIFGLIMFFIDRDYVSLYILIGIAACVLIHIRPRKGELIRLAIKMKQAPLFDRSL